MNGQRVIHWMLFSLFCQLFINLKLPVKKQGVLFKETLHSISFILGLDVLIYKEGSVKVT